MKKELLSLKKLVDEFVYCTDPVKKQDLEYELKNRVDSYNKSEQHKQKTKMKKV